MRCWTSLGLALSLMGMPARAAVVDQHNLEHPVVRPGIEVLLGEDQYLTLVQGKRVGLITNPTGVDHELNSTIDLLHRNPDINLVALFGPEHGIRGDAYAGENVENVTDPTTGVPIYSLYGATSRPTPEMLEGIDVMLYDIQDVGSRSYTYIYTMARAMDACGEARIPFVVLDRPNPCGADIVDGNILNPEEGTSGVGLYPIAYQYGMTPGETAQMFNAEFLEHPCELTVVPMRGYRRDMLQWDTGLPFVPTSTHIPHADDAVFYQLTGIIGELHNISIAVGYTLPFETIAAPYIRGDELCQALRDLNLPGLMYRPISYVPRYGPFSSTPGSPEAGGQTCHGVQIFISNFHTVRPVSAQIHYMEVLQRLYPEQNLFGDDNRRSNMFDKVMGTSSIRHRILAGDHAADIIADYQGDVDSFMQRRQKYLIYE
jgi:uncharacterized protein YbbC (DUF1343 family)